MTTKIQIQQKIKLLEVEGRHVPHGRIAGEATGEC